MLNYNIIILEDTPFVCLFYMGPRMFTHALRKNACFLGANIRAEMEPITRTALSIGRPASCVLSEMQLLLKGGKQAAGGVQAPGGSHN